MIDRLEALERLARLRDSGVLSGPEFESEKVRILEGNGGSGGPASAGNTDDLQPEVSQPAGWKARLYRRRWLVGGAAVSLAVGSLLAFAVWGDIKSVSSGSRAVRVAAPAGAEDRPVNLGSVLRFQDIGTCRPSEGLDELIRTMIGQPGTSTPSQGRPIRVAGFEEPIAPTVAAGSGDGPTKIVEIAVPGTWQGLHVTRLHAANWGTDDVASLQIHFREQPEQALSLLKQIGLPLSRVGELKEAGDALVGLEAIADGSALTCVRDKRTGSRKPVSQEDRV